MLILGGILSALLLIVIALFAFPAFSPIPYFPTNKKDLEKILGALKLADNQTIIDLGAGDGLVIFEAANRAYKKKLSTRFAAVEINPILIMIMYLRRFFHPNKKCITILFKDMFQVHEVIAQDDLVFYLYVSPWFLKNIYTYLKKQYQDFTIVSYMYEVPDLKPKQMIQGHHKIFVY